MSTIFNFEDKSIDFKREIFNTYIFDDITVVIFAGDYPQKEINYNNALALSNKDGNVLWEIEEYPEWDFKNPYEGVHDAGAYLTFFKANSIKVVVNRRNGKVIRNLNFNTGERPW